MAYQYIANAVCTLFPTFQSSYHLPPPPTPSQGGIEEESAYPYCSGSGQCYPCVPKGYNKTRCGPPPSYCNKTDSCDVKLNNSNFVSGLKVKSWIAIAKVWGGRARKVASCRPNMFNICILDITIVYVQSPCYLMITL